MNPWVESFGVLVLAAGGASLGAWFSRLPKPWWALGYFIPLSLVVIYDISNHYPALTQVPPVSWVMHGRTIFAMTGFMGAMLLTTPVLKLPQRRDRIAVGILTVCLVLFTSVWPFLASAFNQKELAGLTTKIDSDGVCLQTTDYTCGPAAAVTGLRRLGFKAEESELALLAHTTSATGTPAEILTETLNERFGKEGLVAESRVFKDTAELKACCPVLAVIKFNFIVDHYVTVLDVNDRAITIGDPLHGMVRLSVADFKDKWRFTGIVLKRK